MQSQVSDLLIKVAKLGAIQQRQIYAILGAIVADAATLPCHWVYDQGKLVELQKKTPNLEFYPEGQCPFYVLPVGNNSIHGGALAVNLTSLQQDNNVQTATQFIANNITNDDSIYMVAQAKKAEKKYPIQGPWLMGSYVAFKENYEKKIEVTGDPETKDMDGFISTFASTVKACSSEVLNEKSIEQYIRIVSNSEISVKYGLLEANIIHQIIQGKNLDDATSIKDADVDEVKSKKSEDNSSVSKSFGLACGNPGNFKGAFHALISSSDYKEGVRKCIHSGGENAARSFFVGAALGALYGAGTDKGIPLEWINQTNSGIQTLTLALEIFGK